MNDDDDDLEKLRIAEELKKTQKIILHDYLEKELMTMPETNTHKENCHYIAGVLGAFEHFSDIDQETIDELYLMYVH
jgi:hypothetical protein